MTEQKPSTILIVDDDRTVIEQLVTHFKRRGYEPIATADPTVVERTLESFEVHLILLDLRMEKLNGYEVLKRLREKKIKVPVLIITAYYQDEKDRLKQVGITPADVIEKPFRDFSKIEAAINRKLNKTVVPAEVGSDYEDEIYYDNRTKVVVVDDEPEITSILAEFLKERRYQVKTFGDGKKALEYIKANKDGCDVAIVDMAIPGLLGHELIREASKVNPRIKFIPVSAKFEEDVRGELKSVGFDADQLVTKPFRLPVLVERIKVLATEAGTLGSVA